MKLLYQYDEEGFYTEPVFSHDVDRLNIEPERLTDITPPDLIRAKFVDGQWIEGADDEYIEIIKPVPEENPMDVMMEQNALLIMELAETKLTNEFLLGQQTELLLFIANKYDPANPIGEDELEEIPNEATPSEPPSEEDPPSNENPSIPDEDGEPENEEPTEPIEEGENG